MSNTINLAMFGKTNNSMIRILKPILLTFCKTNARQAHFVTSAIDLIAHQQAYVVRLESKVNKKKTTFWSRFKFVIFGKK